VRIIALGNESFPRAYANDLPSTAREVLLTVVIDGPVSVKKIADLHHLNERTAYDAVMTLRSRGLASGVKGSGGLDKARLKLAPTSLGRQLVSRRFPGEPSLQLRLRRDACAALRVAGGHPTGPSEADQLGVLIWLYLRREERPTVL